MLFGLSKTTSRETAMTETTSTPTPIIIDLTNSNGDHAREDGQLIQQQAFKAILGKINSSLQAGITARKSSKKSDNGLVFFIDGTRGAGKSTFLRTLVDKLGKQTTPKLKCLIEIDPTKVEVGEHIFISLLQQLQGLINETSRHHFCDSNSNSDKYESWRKDLRALADGLQLLDGKRNPLDGIDPEAFLEWGMERAKGGLDFADKFKELIESACKILDVDALIVAIDDADTNFAKGKQILEVIRRYLDTNRIVTLMTGDLQLYSHLVRDLYYDNLGESIHKHDPHRSEERKHLVDHLEAQYLQKLFPIQHRAHLKPLWELKNQVEYTIPIDSKTEFKLEALINKLLEEGLFIKASSDIDRYQEFLLKQPLRSVVQLLQFCTEDMSEEKRFKTERVAEGLRSMLLGSLYTEQVDVDALSAGDMAALNDAVFNAVVKDGEFDTGYYLRPQPSDESLCNTFVALAAEVSRHCQHNPGKAIQYILQGPGSTTLFNSIEPKIESKTNKNYSYDEKKYLYIKYLSIGRSEDALNWAWHASPLLIPNNTVRAVRCGVIGLTRNKTEDDKISAISFLNDMKTKTTPTAFSLSLINVSSGTTKTYASIFNCIALATRLLSTPRSSQSTSQKITAIQIELNKVYNTPTISPPPWIMEGGDVDAEHFTNEAPQQYLENIAIDIQKWLNRTHKTLDKVEPSSILLGKIWSRLYFSLISVADYHRPRNGVATIMEFYALATINAFLVEESDHHTRCIENEIVTKPQRTNPVTSTEKVIEKFKTINPNTYPLTSIISTCPLIIGHLQESNAKQLTNDLGYKMNGLNKYTFDELNKVQINKG